MSEPKKYRFVVIGLEDIDGIRKHVYRVRFACEQPDGKQHRLVIEGDSRDIFAGFPKGSDVEVSIQKTQTTLTPTED